jgi:hypothetical protein
LLQPELDVHLAEHCGGDGKVLAGPLPVSGPPVQFCLARGGSARPAAAYRAARRGPAPRGSESLAALTIVNTSTLRQRLPPSWAPLGTPRQASERGPADIEIDSPRPWWEGRAPRWWVGCASTPASSAGLPQRNGEDAATPPHLAASTIRAGNYGSKTGIGSGPQRLRRCQTARLARPRPRSAIVPGSGTPDGGGPPLVPTVKA